VNPHNMPYNVERACLEKRRPEGRSGEKKKASRPKVGGECMNHEADNQRRAKTPKIHRNELKRQRKGRKAESRSEDRGKGTN